MRDPRRLRIGDQVEIRGFIDLRKLLWRLARNCDFINILNRGSSSIYRNLLDLDLMSRIELALHRSMLSSPGMARLMRREGARTESVVAQGRAKEVLRAANKWSRREGTAVAVEGRGEAAGSFRRRRRRWRCGEQGRRMVGGVDPGWRLEERARGVARRGVGREGLVARSGRENEREG